MINVAKLENGGHLNDQETLNLNIQDFHINNVAELVCGRYLDDQFLTVSASREA